MTTLLQTRIVSACDQAHEQILDGETHGGMDGLHGRLRELREEAPSLRLGAATILDHPVTDLIHRDPLTWHAFSKPRGYAGDAELLDYIYKIVEPSACSDHGRDVYHYNVDTGACASVRDRRDILAAYIDGTAALVESPRIISIACGHLREAAHSQALRAGRVGELIALDQDASSLAVVGVNNPDGAVRPVKGSVRDLIAGRLTFGDADLVYSAGLYDYLELPVARRLTARMFAMLRPGGRLLIANFAPNLRAIGYMETFMDWHLIYRDEMDIVEVAAEIDESEIATLRVFRDEPGNLVFLEIARG